MAAANKFSFMDILNAQSKADAKTAAVTEYTEIYLNPYDVEETESNFYSQESIEELADAILAVGQQQPTVLGRIDGKYKIISGHRRNKANRLLIDRGYEQYKSVRYLYKDITPAGLELSLLVGNAFNRELTSYEKTEQAARHQPQITALPTAVHHRRADHGTYEICIKTSGHNDLSTALYSCVRYLLRIQCHTGADAGYGSADADRACVIFRCDTGRYG